MMDEMSTSGTHGVPNCIAISYKRQMAGDLNDDLVDADYRDSSWSMSAAISANGTAPSSGSDGASNAAPTI